MKKHITTDFEYEIERLNALINVMRDTGFTIRAHRFRHWRATVRTTGHIIGLEDLGELQLFATDGGYGKCRRGLWPVDERGRGHRRLRTV